MSTILSKTMKNKMLEKRVHLWYTNQHIICRFYTCTTCIVYLLNLYQLCREDIKPKHKTTKGNKKQNIVLFLVTWSVKSRGHAEILFTRGTDWRRPFGPR